MDRRPLDLDAGPVELVEHLAERGDAAVAGDGQGQLVGVGGRARQQAGGGGERLRPVEPQLEVPAGQPLLELGRGALGDDPALVEDGDPVGQLVGLLHMDADPIHPLPGGPGPADQAERVQWGTGSRTSVYPYGNTGKVLAASCPCECTDVGVEWEALMASTRHEHPVDPDRVAHARRRGISAEDAGRLSGLLSLLSDPSRARILYALDLVEELCVGDLALALDLSEDAVGYALKLLRTAGLVATRKQGRVVFYRLADRFPEPLLEHCLRQLITLSRVASDESDEEEGPR